MSAQDYDLGPDLLALAQECLAKSQQTGRMVTTAESCTGGLVAACLSEVAGSSAMLDRGFVTYSNAAKMDMLGVSASTLAQFGAVSSETASEMAIGALNNSNANVAVSITGIAGPAGGSADKPVGLVYFGLAIDGLDVRTEKHVFVGDQSAPLSRNQIRQCAAKIALGLILRGLKTDIAG